MIGITLMIYFIFNIFITCCIFAYDQMKMIDYQINWEHCLVISIPFTDIKHGIPWAYLSTMFFGVPLILYSAINDLLNKGGEKHEETA